MKAPAVRFELVVVRHPPRRTELYRRRARRIRRAWHPAPPCRWCSRRILRLLGEPTTPYTRGEPDGSWAIPTARSSSIPACRRRGGAVAAPCVIERSSAAHLRPDHVRM